MDRAALERVLGLGANEGWQDVEFTEPSVGPLVVVSTDVVEPPGPDGELAGAIALAHAFSDLYASLAVPEWCVVAMGVTPRDVSSGRAAGFVAGIRRAAGDAGAQLLGGHSRYETTTSLTITVCGRAVEPAPRRQARDGDLILLGSKPLGSGVLLSAVRQGAIDEVPRATLKTMALTSEQDSSWLGTYLWDHLVGVTDVTGYGLIGALRGLTQTAGWELSTAHLRLLPQVRTVLAAQATSTLGDANWRDFGDGIAFEVEGGAMRAIVFDPQTAGPLLAIVRPTARDCLAAAGNPFAVVGTVRSDARRIVTDR